MMSSSTFTRTFLSILAVSSALYACKAGEKGAASNARIDADRTPVPVKKAQLDDDISNTRRNAITRAVEHVAPAVVGINVTEVQEVRYRDPFLDEFSDDPMFQRFFGGQRAQTYKQEIHALGSGFIISQDGYVVTNDHVAGSASKVIVTMTDGKKYDAKLVGSDRTSDIALLKINGSNFPFVDLGSSSDVIVGEWAIALGNPFGLFDINSKPTVTVGVISNTGVNLSPQEQRIYRGMLQTDAAISSGNSGGPLVNSLGQVIGVNATIYSTARTGQGAGSIGIGFAIPIDRARGIIEQLRKNGKIDRDFWTGMRYQQIDERAARYFKLGTTDGVVVVELAPDSPASRAGLEFGDVITAINGEMVKTEDGASTLLYDSRVGDTLRLKILRDGKEMEKTITLTRRPG
ncbi:MAG: Trypsin-like serine protease [Chlorobi bacterium]|nr:Trypsin-like serine protease [Chlorobiota bacterium]